MPFLIAFFVLSFAEIYMFAFMGDQIGALNTLILCFVTAIIGGFLVRLQGITTLMSAQANLRGGKLPVNELFDGFSIVIAGVALITPGFLTDIVGFLLLFPPFRFVLKEFILKKTKFEFYEPKSQQNNDNLDRADAIEGDYQRVDKDNSSSH